MRRPVVVILLAGALLSGWAEPAFAKSEPKATMAMDPPKRSRDVCPGGGSWAGRPHGFGPISWETGTVELDFIEAQWAWDIEQVLGPRALDYSGSYITRRVRSDLLLGEVWVSGQFITNAEPGEAQAPKGKVVVMAQRYYIYLGEGRWPEHKQNWNCRTWVQPDQPDQSFYEGHEWIDRSPPKPFGGGDFPHPDMPDGIEPPQ